MEIRPQAILFTFMVGTAEILHRTVEHTENIYYPPDPLGKMGITMNKTTSDGYQYWANSQSRLTTK